MPSLPLLRHWSGWECGLALRAKYSPRLFAIVTQPTKEGYLLAHGNGDGEGSLHFIPNFEDPPPYVLDELSPTIESRSTAPLDLDPGSGLATPAFVGASGGAADHVAIALGAHDRDADAQARGVLWQQGCGDAAVELWSAALTCSEGIPGSFGTAQPVRINAKGGSAVQPGAAIAYAASAG